MTEKHVSVTIPISWMAGFVVVGAAAGLGASFVIGPLVNWLLELIGDAPGPLRVAAALPPEVVIPVLCFAGMCFGIVAAREWRKDVGVTTISTDGVTVQRGAAGQHVDREQISGVFVDGHDLVLVDHQTRELLRSKSDPTLAGRLQHGFERFDYPWQGGTDPHESEYVTWIDGKGPVDARAHALLRARQRALADAQLGAAQNARDELRALGISVRDRDHAQQYRATALD